MPRPRPVPYFGPYAERIKNEIYAFTLDASHLITLLFLRLHLHLTHTPESTHAGKYAAFHGLPPPPSPSAAPQTSHASSSHTSHHRHHLPHLPLHKPKQTSIDIAIIEAVEKLRQYATPRVFLGEKVARRGIEVQDREKCKEFVGVLRGLRGELGRVGRGQGLRGVEAVERLMVGWTRGEGCGVGG